MGIVIKYKSVIPEARRAAKLLRDQMLLEKLIDVATLFLNIAQQAKMWAYFNHERNIRPIQLMHVYIKAARKRWPAVSKLMEKQRPGLTKGVNQLLKKVERARLPERYAEELEYLAREVEISGGSLCPPSKTS